MTKNIHLGTRWRRALNLSKVALAADGMLLMLQPMPYSGGEYTQQGAVP